MSDAAFARLPENFRRAAGRITLHVQDFADRDVLDELKIDHPINLSGLYQGVPLTQESVSFPAPENARIYLYRQPILAELRTRPDVTLEELIDHVLIHELGHHFGYSDDDMHGLLSEAE